MTNTVERVARAIAEEFEAMTGGPLNPKVKNALARAAIAEYEAALKEDGLVIVPQEPTEEIRRAFSACTQNDPAVVDKMEPEIGTGQGDLAFVPVFENLWWSLEMSTRYQAMIKAWEDG